MSGLDQSLIFTVVIPEVVFTQLSTWGWAHSCSNHVEDLNECIIEKLCGKLVTYQKTQDQVKVRYLLNTKSNYSINSTVYKINHSCSCKTSCRHVGGCTQINNFLCISGLERPINTTQTLVGSQLQIYPSWPN